MNKNEFTGVEDKLQKAFRFEDLEWRLDNAKFIRGGAEKYKACGNKVLSGMIESRLLVYVTNRAIQRRLDNVFGACGWKNEFKDYPVPGNKAVLCGISVKFDGEWITKWDGAPMTNFEAEKGGLSDAMKRAAYQWGIGRYLYQFGKNSCVLPPTQELYWKAPLTGKFKDKVLGDIWFRYRNPISKDIDINLLHEEDVKLLRG